MKKGARVVVIDPATMTAESLTQPWLDGNTWTTIAFVDDQTLALFTGETAHNTHAAYLFKYPGFEVIADITPASSDGGPHEYPIVMGGCLFRQVGGSLMRLDQGTRQWECLIKDWTDGYAVTAPWQGRAIASVDVCGVTRLYDVATGRSDSLDLEATGFMAAHALCVLPEKNLKNVTPIRYVLITHIRQEYSAVELRRNVSILENKIANL